MSKKIKIWIDDVRPIPNTEEYIAVKSVNEAKQLIESIEKGNTCLIIECIDIDHDAGDYAYDGGDYIKLLDWLEMRGSCYPIHIHSMNPVGIANMRAIIKNNGWLEI